MEDLWALYNQTYTTLKGSRMGRSDKVSLGM